MREKALPPFAVPDHEDQSAANDAGPIEVADPEARESPGPVCADDPAGRRGGAGEVGEEGQADVILPSRHALKTVSANRIFSGAVATLKDRTIQEISSSVGTISRDAWVAASFFGQSNRGPRGKTAVNQFGLRPGKPQHQLVTPLFRYVHSSHLSLFSRSAMYLGRPSLDFSGSLGDHGKDRDGIDCPVRPRSQPVPVLKEEAAHPKTFAELLFAATDEKKAGKELQAGRSSRACRGSFSGRAKYGMQAFSFREFLLMRERALPPFAVPVTRINPLPTTQARLKRMATKPVKAPDPFAPTIQPVAEVVPVKLVKKVGPV